MPNNIAYTTAKYVLIDLIGDILYWPVWWYTRGLVKTGLFCWQSVKNQEEKLGLLIWIKNITTPMFGQYDWEGRLISFFVRLIQIIFRAAILLVWIILVLGFFLLYVFLPLIIIHQLYANLSVII